MTLLRIFEFLYQEAVQVLYGSFKLTKNQKRERKKKLVFGRGKVYSLSMVKKLFMKSLLSVIKI